MVILGALGDLVWNDREHQQKSNNDQNLMLGVYLSIKTNS